MEYSSVCLAIPTPSTERFLGREGGFVSTVQETESAGGPTLADRAET